MKLSCTLKLAALLLLSLPTVSSAADSAEAVARKYLQATKTGLPPSADYFSNDDLERFKSSVLPAMQKASDKSSDTRHIELMTAEEPRDFMRSFLEIIDLKQKIAGYKPGESSIVGQIREGDLVHFIVRQNYSSQEKPYSQLHVVSLRPSGNSWTVLLPDFLNSMIVSQR